MSTELDGLQERAAELAGRLDEEESLEVNAAILDLQPGDPVATNRLGIGLLHRSRPREAVEVFTAGLKLHPDNSIMRNRLAEAEKALDLGTTAPSAPSKPRRTGGESTGWTDFDPSELVEHALRGPGRDACVRLCAASIRSAESIDQSRTAVTPLKTGKRFRVVGGVVTGVSPIGPDLTVAVPQARRAVIDAVIAAGGQELDPAKSITSVIVSLPRGEVEALYDLLLPAHVEHLRSALAAGPPTHLRRHHEGLRTYLLEEAAKLEPLAGGGA